ncbi:MAG: RtcB family protein, partial [Clostridia bacterium]|nr:RtcB family protein [Clostridia bacterium]
MCDNPAFADSKIRIMPDVHAGAGCTIGTTMTITDKIVPNMVGVDIGCGMELAELAEKEIDFAKLDALIYKRIPSGMNSRVFAHAYADETNLASLRCYAHINAKLARLSVGTLGGGNHFIEVDRDDEGKLYLVVHSGSRHLGLEVANYYQKEAYKTLCGVAQSQIDAIIDRLKAEGREREISGAIAEAKSGAANVGVSPDTAYVCGRLFDDYIHDMKIVQRYAVINRRAMVDEMVDGMGLTVVGGFTTIHNYIDTESMILRKGAVSARAGEKLLIPLNMRDGSLICTGLGNSDWNYSAPHGAGRLMSRGKAFATLDVEEFGRQM